MIADTAYMARHLQVLGEWDAALEVLGPDTTETHAELRAEIAVERWFFQMTGHDEAEQAVAALDQDTPTAQVLRARLAYSRLLFNRDPRPDDRDASEAGYRDAVCGDDEAVSGWAEFHWGCLLDNIDGDSDAAQPHFKTAHEAALRNGDRSLESICVRHLSAREEPAERVRMLRHSLHLRSALGIRPYSIAAQASLAARLPEDDPERALLTESVRIGAEALGIAWLLGGGSGSTEDFED